MARLQHGIADEGALRLVRLGQFQRPRRDNLVISVQQSLDLDSLAGVVGRSHQPHPLDKTKFHKALLARL